jgi:hypothetical protein
MINRYEDYSCYLDSYRYCSMALLRIGYEYFLKAPAIKNLGAISEILTQVEKECPKDISGYFHSVLMLTDEKIDAIFMVTAFELIALALLINERVAVHVVDKNKAPILAATQKDKPINVDDVVKQEELLYGKENFNDKILRNETNGLKVEILTKNTLKLSSILRNDNYCKKIDFDDKLIAILKTLIKRRNNHVHFFSICVEHDVLKSADGYTYLKNLIESKYIPLHNKLVTDSGYPETWKIKSQ